MRLLSMIYRNRQFLLMENYNLMTCFTRCIFYGKLILKNIAFLDSMIVSTYILGISDFIIKNLYLVLWKE